MIGPRQWRVAGSQVAVAALVALGAWLLQRNITAPEGASAFEILFDPTFWSSFALAVATYLAIAAAAGWIVGVCVALAVLAGVAAARDRWLPALLVIPATCAVLAVVGAFLVA